MSAARKHDELTAGLVLRGRFPTFPSAAVISAFLKHVVDTGRPETFDGISDTRPPEDGVLRVLTDFDAPRGKRGDGSMAPCPICSPTDPQFHSGVLIWCEASAAIYAIGINCAAELWKDGKLDREIASFRRRKADEALDTVLLERLPIVPEQRAWIAGIMPSARRTDVISRSFRKTLPAVAYSLGEVARAGAKLTVHRRVHNDLFETGSTVREETIGMLEGTAFVEGPSQVEKQLRICDETLRAADFGANDDNVLAAVCSMSEADKVKCSKYLQQAERQMAKASERIKATWDFTRPSNLAMIQAWGAEQYERVSAQGNGIKAWVDCGGNIWAAELKDLTVPPPLPAND